MARGLGAVQPDSGPAVPSLRTGPVTAAICVHPISPVWWFCAGDGPHLVSMSTHSTLSAASLAIWSEVPTVT